MCFVVSHNCCILSHHLGHLYIMFFLSKFLFSLLYAYIIPIDPSCVIAITISLGNPLLFLPSKIKSLYYIF